jgi:integrase
MNTKPAGRKALKGSVQIRNSHGRLQLRFSHADKRYLISTGLVDTPISRKAAQMKANLIESDLADEKFDPTLAKYKPVSSLSTVMVDVPPALTIKDLWEEYIKGKSKTSSPKTLASTYAPITRLLEKCKTDPLSDASGFRAELLQITTNKEVRRTLMHLSACMKSSMKRRFIGSNPIDGMYLEVKVSEPQRAMAFTVSERDAIINAFENHRIQGCSFQHYAPFVKALFWTGMRPSEALGLRWGDLPPDCSRISITGGVVDCNGTLVRRESTKTGVNRKLPCVPKLRELLLSIRPKNPAEDALVFPSPRGGAIGIGNFSQRAWRTILESIGLYKKDGCVMTPYACRDTWISHQVAAGVPVAVVANWSGNSPNVITRKYLDKEALSHLKPADV